MLYALWAKLGRQGDKETYHPLPCHLVDVAMVAQALWERGLTEAVRQHTAHVLGVEEATAKVWVTFLVGSHDVGKASADFQLRPEGNYLERAAAAQVQSAGYPNPTILSPRPHSVLTTLCLEDWLQARSLDAEHAKLIALAVGGHHGVIPEANELQHAKRAPDPQCWQDARKQALDTLASVLELPKECPKKVDVPTATLIAGLSSVADWIGSIVDFFPHVGQLGKPPQCFSLSSYAHQARKQAERAITELLWNAPPRQPPAHFSDIFPSLTPRPLQEQVGNLAGELDPLKPALVIMEAPTGEGKTEAAWLLADSWSVSGPLRGVYVAMPTMATSNALFSRVRGFLEQRYPTAGADHRIVLQLLHGHADLSAELEELLNRIPPTPDVTEDSSPSQPLPSPVTAGEWFTARKRGLLAPFGVGTVDQALLSALRVRHGFVRLFGLSHRTVIFDEVHAYDTYMTELLERLLEWLAAMGSRVVILSATLPAARRQRLATAFLRGLDPEASEVSENWPPYPRISWINQERVGSKHVPASEESRKRVKLTWLPDAEEGLAKVLRDALKEGGCAAIVCNTVSQAQSIYKALKGHLSEKELDLLHARYRFCDRQEREARVLRHFGKPDGRLTLPTGEVVTVQRPPRAVLVATQIIEQSLDLDFDLMVSMPAPVDLLLQRAGRLHRHRRDRPPGLTEPRLYLLRPGLDSGDVPQFDAGTRAVYDGHLLLRTWLTLKDRQHIAVPDDVDCLIREVYDDRQPPDHLSNALRDAWKSTRESLEKSFEYERNEAKKRWIPQPAGIGKLWELTQHFTEEDRPEIHSQHQALTRLAEPTLTVVPCYGTLKEAQLNCGDEPTDLTAAADARLARKVLKHSLPVSGRRIVPMLQKELQNLQPKSWRQSSLLCHCYPLPLDQDNRYILKSGLTLRYDTELGLIVDRETEDDP